MNSGIKFLTLGIELTDEESSRLEKIHKILGYLASRKQSELPAFEPSPRSPTSWNIAIYWKALLYRLVGTTKGAIITWNSGNTLCSFLAARALLETVAVAWHYHRAIVEALDDGDLDAVEQITQRQMFASREKAYLQSDLGMKATNIITFIDKLDKQFPIYRMVYDDLSERCHPNSLGTFQMFATVDPDAGIVAYSDRHKAEEDFRLILATVGLIEAVKIMTDEVDDLINGIDTLDREHQ
jgi:hypothetical protein